MSRRSIDWLRLLLDRDQQRFVSSQNEFERETRTTLTEAHRAIRKIRAVRSDLTRLEDAIDAAARGAGVPLVSVDAD